MSRRAGPNHLHQTIITVSAGARSGEGVQPRYSGLRVQSTASTPSSTTGGHPIVRARTCQRPDAHNTRPRIGWTDTGTIDAELFWAKTSKQEYRLRPMLGVHCQLEHWAERVGFEPTVPCGTRALQARRIGHSRTSPRGQCDSEYNKPLNIHLDSENGQIRS